MLTDRCGTLSSTNSSGSTGIVDANDAGSIRVSSSANAQVGAVKSPLEVRTLPISNLSGHDIEMGRTVETDLTTLRRACCGDSAGRMSKLLMRRCGKRTLVCQCINKAIHPLNK